MNKEVKDIDDVISEIIEDMNTPKITYNELERARKKFEKVLLGVEKGQALECIVRLSLKVLSLNR